LVISPDRPTWRIRLSTPVTNTLAVTEDEVDIASLEHPKPPFCMIVDSVVAAIIVIKIAAQHVR
jgi:hypothetical protein